MTQAIWVNIVATPAGWRLIRPAYAGGRYRRQAQHNGPFAAAGVGGNRGWFAYAGPLWFPRQ